MNKLNNSSHNLPTWSIRLALRAAQLVKNAPANSEIPLTLRVKENGRIEVLTQRVEVLETCAETAVN